MILRRALPVIAALGLVVTLGACGDTDVETGTVAGKAGGTPVDGARTLDVDAKNFSFSPDELEVDAKEELAFSLHSEEGPHDFAVDGIGMIADVADGETDTVRLRVDESGTYTFFCTLPGHRDGGMEGTLVVRKP